MSNWIKYSGASIVIKLNPLHWRLLPRAEKEVFEWSGPKEWTASASWLFLTVRLWIDDGSW